MKQFIILFVAVAFICIAAYGQGEEGASQSKAFPFDHEQVLYRLAALKPFKIAKEEFEQAGYSFLVTQEEFRNSLMLLIKKKEKVDEIMASFDTAAAFAFKGDTQLLTLMQWADDESAHRFMQLRFELWRLTDEEYKQFLKKVAYEEIVITKDEKALLTRKTIQQGGQQQDVTTFVSARGKYVFECTLIGGFTDREVKKLTIQIWEIIESEEKKGAR
jgi:hypothetical protein